LGHGQGGVEATLGHGAGKLGQSLDGTRKIFGKDESHGRQDQNHGQRGNPGAVVDRAQGLAELGHGLAHETDADRFARRVVKRPIGGHVWFVEQDELAGDGLVMLENPGLDRLVRKRGADDPPAVLDDGGGNAGDAGKQRGLDAERLFDAVGPGIARGRFLRHADRPDDDGVLVHRYGGEQGKPVVANRRKAHGFPAVAHGFPSSGQGVVQVLGLAGAGHRFPGGVKKQNGGDAAGAEAVLGQTGQQGAVAVAEARHDIGAHGLAFGQGQQIGAQGVQTLLADVFIGKDRGVIFLGKAALKGELPGKEHGQTGKHDAGDHKNDDFGGNADTHGVWRRGKCSARKCPVLSR